MQEFVMLVGPSGCGKSTWAKEFNENHDHQYIIHSSDAIRGELWGDENDQQNPAKIFEVLHHRVRESLQQGDNVIYDATNLNAKRRKNYLKQLKQQMAADGIEVEYNVILVVADFEQCCRNNYVRDRKVSREVIHRHFLQIQIPFYNEGWDNVFFIRNSHPISWGEVLFMLDIPHDNEHHPNDVLAHSLKVAAAMGEPFSFGWKVGVLHDLGKPMTKVWNKPNGSSDGQAHYYNHQNVGAYLSFLVKGEKEKIEDAEVYARAMIIQYHMEPWLRKGEALEKFYEGLDSFGLIFFIKKLNKADGDCA